MILVQLKSSAESNNFSFWALWWQRTIALCGGWTFHLTLKAVSALIDHAKNSYLSDRCSTEPSVQIASLLFALFCCSLLRKELGALSAVWLPMQMLEWSLHSFSWSSSPVLWVQSLLFHRLIAKALYGITSFHLFQAPNLGHLENEFSECFTVA